MAQRAPPVTAAHPRSGRAPRGWGVGLFWVASMGIGSAWLSCACVPVSVSGVVIFPSFLNRGFGTLYVWGGSGGIVLWALGCARVDLSIGVLSRLTVLLLWCCEISISPGAGREHLCHAAACYEANSAYTDPFDLLLRAFKRTFNVHLY